MASKHELQRFLDAQQGVYETALKEIKNGRKKSHWMWYVFPQIGGLGFSDTSRFYGIKNKEEATDYLHHEVLSKRLIEISSALLNLSTNNAVDVFGSTDSMKLQSSMTLFSALDNTDPVFEKVLQKFFGGKKDDATLRLLKTMA